MHPFALHSRFEAFVSLVAAAVAGLSILGSVVYLFVHGAAIPVTPQPRLAKAAAATASAPQPAPTLAATSDAY
ncbi:MAG TPA: hypothetical protein VGQ23_18685 [Burkholderiaceae bacterium]|nr:hypothetical protein [Burkholderiaceae bacterium]